ncbi:MAG: class I SAM-dependent rRNA methyltransferase, partial [Deltaproteobacteria bacterium]|nr:class I SAM-dependent rRNA methyltransferase [Deltaproteobacteria bacterium]
VVDVENEVVRAWTLEPVQAFDAAFFKARVRRALELRRALGLVLPEESGRAINAEGDGLGGITADVFGPWGVVYAYSKGLWTCARSVAEQLREQAGLRAVVVKLRVRGGAKPGQVKQEVVGEDPPESVVVKELGVPFEVHPLGGLNVGLFTDMREHRRNLARFVHGRRVLNTFAYTGALSVAAARAGAAAVTSVDLSSGVLKWAAENFRLSGLDPADARWKFEVSDVARFMERAVEAGRSYDTVILDPPTYSAARAHAWSMKKDYPDLIANAARLCPEESGGLLWVSANAHGGKGVLQHAEEGIRKAGRRAVIMETGGLPPDYPTPLGWPDGRYLEVAFLRVLPQ